MSTKPEYIEAILEVFSDYVSSKQVTKAVQEEIAKEIVIELEERGLIELEEEELDEEEGSSDLDELPF